MITQEGVLVEDQEEVIVLDQECDLVVAEEDGLEESKERDLVVETKAIGGRSRGLPAEA